MIFSSFVVKMEEAISFCASRLGIDHLRDQQRSALVAFLRGHDLFVSLPTGFGKSVIFLGAPLCYGQLNDDEINFAIVVMPIKALIKDQMDKCRRLQIGAADLSGGLTDDIRERLCEGKIKIFFSSPEFLTGEEGRDFMRLNEVQDHLCGLFVDESHCVTKWGQSSGKTQAFRSSYGHLAELRSTLPTVPVVALTATASIDVRAKVATGLGMTNYEVISESPDKPNIKHVVIHMSHRDFDSSLKFLVDELVTQREETDRTILYCQSRKVAAELYSMFCSLTPKLCRKHFEMYHTNTEADVQERVLQDFANPDGHIRILIATIAFGMGVDVKNTHTAIMVGRPSDLDDYLQMAGRIGRDGKPSTAIVLTYPGDAVGRPASKAMAMFLNGEKCRRQVILDCFMPSAKTKELKTHFCCDVCASTCKCGGSRCNVTVPRMESLARGSCLTDDKVSEFPVHIPTSAQVDKLQSSLEEYRDSLVSTSPDHLYSGKDIASGLPESTIQKIVRESTVMLTEIEFSQRYSFSSVDICKRAWEIYLTALERSESVLPGQSEAIYSDSTDSENESDVWSGDEFANAVLDSSHSESD